jgi:hypothetical protein
MAGRPRRGYAGGVSPLQTELEDVSANNGMLEGQDEEILEEVSPLQEPTDNGECDLTEDILLSFQDNTAPGMIVCFGGAGLESDAKEGTGVAASEEEPK